MTSPHPEQNTTRRAVRLLPDSRLMRRVALVWLAACVAALLAMLAQGSLYANERSALVMLVPVYFLALPSAHLAFMAVAKVKLALYLDAGIVPSMLTEGVCFWALAVTLGYVQWFVALPWLMRRCRPARSTGKL